MNDFISFQNNPSLQSTLHLALEQPSLMHDFTFYPSLQNIQQQLERNVIHQTRSCNYRDVRI